MVDLVGWLTACLDEDALWATEASRRYGQAAHEDGVHWQWVEPETDTPVAVDPTRDERLTDDAGNFRFSLRSVEEFPREHVGPLPLFALHSVEEIPVAVAGHIVAWDPARVLREIDAKREIVRAYQDAVAERDNVEVGTDAYHRSVGTVTSLRRVLCLHATTYAHRPGFKEEWRP